MPILVVCSSSERQGAELQHKNVDPGALLIAVFTVGLAPLTEDGPWANAANLVFWLGVSLLFWNCRA